MRISIFGAFALLASLLVSCTTDRKINERSYTYIETIREHNLFGGSSVNEKDEKIIKAASDSSAYIDAFTLFCISHKVYADMYKKGHGEYLDEPLGFKLLNDKGEDITNIEFVTRTAQEGEIAAQYAAMDNIVDNPEYRTDREKVSQIDSAKIETLLPYFNVVKDEFDPDGRVWYRPKSAPKYINANGIYLYFAVMDDKVQPLRFKVQYYADDWLFFRKVQFSINGEAYEFIPFNTETDHNGGKIWEWYDESLTGSDRELIYALANAQTAKMKFIGRQYYDIKTITAKQIESIKQTLELYNAMGGNY